jgi:hypothetical protein
VTKATLIKESISLGLAYSFRGSVHYHHGLEYGSKQADLVQERELRRIYNLIYREREREIGAWQGLLKPTSSDSLLPTRPYLLILLILLNSSTS